MMVLDDEGEPHRLENTGGGYEMMVFEDGGIMLETWYEVGAGGRGAVIVVWCEVVVGYGCSGTELDGSDGGRTIVSEALGAGYDGAGAEL